MNEKSGARTGCNIILRGDIMTVGQWIALLILALAAGMMIFIPVSTLVGKRRARKGKGHIYKGKLREIVVVKKRVTEREFFETGLNLNHTGPINRSTHKTVRNASVDYRVVGKKTLHTKFINEDTLKRLQVGKTYEVLIRRGCIERVFHK